MAVKNRAASALARLRNQAKGEGIPFQMMLQLFVQEEFLRRLSASDYNDNFVLKGGMFIYILTEFKFRPTRDIDFLARNFHVSLEDIEKTMQEICDNDSQNDFIKLDVLRTEPITAAKKYPGVKTYFMGHIDNVRIPFSVDIGLDDVIVPGPVKRKVVTRLPDFEPPYVYTYSLESTIAEKFDAILQRMAGTSRMKDFYDIYYLSGVFDFSGQILRKAVSSTLSHRKRELPNDAFEEIDAFKDTPFLNVQWNAFEPAKNVNLSFADTVDRLRTFLEPVYRSILEGTGYDCSWSGREKAWSAERE